MSIFQRRLIILIDEWLGILLCCWTYHAHREAFWPVFAAFVVLTYFFGYIPYWVHYDKWWRSKD